MKKVPNVPGVYFRLDKAGRKTYYLRLKQGSRQTWRRVGPRLQDAKDLWYSIKLGKVEDSLGVKLPRKTLFKSLSADYFEYYKTKAKERNWDRVKSIIKHLDEFFGRIEVPKISLWTVENYIRHRRKWSVRKPAPSTLNLELDYLKAILGRGVDRKVLDKIPKISKLPVHENRARILSGEELEIVIARVSHDHRDAILLALDTGMREGELFRLEPQDVDFKLGVIHVDETKNLKARSVPMTSRAREILIRRFKTHGERLFRFTTVNMMSQNFGRERRRIEEVPRWRFHDLRHCFCTALLRKGVDPYTVMKLAGHSDIKMVTRYLHTDDDLKKAAIAALEEIPAVTKEGPNGRRPSGVS